MTVLHPDRSLWHAERYTDCVHSLRNADTRAPTCPCTREGPAEPWVAAQKELCTKSNARCGDAHTITSQPCWRCVVRLERSFRAEGALSMRAPEDIVGIRLTEWRHPPVAAWWARRSCFTHQEMSPTIKITYKIQ